MMEKQFMSKDSCARHPDVGKPNPGPKPNAKAPVGQGGRFAAVAKSVAAGSRGKHPRGGSAVRDPGAVAAAIGRKKYGKAAFQKMAAAGRRGK